MYLAYDFIEGDHNFFEKEEDAVKYCEDTIEYYRDRAMSEGWEDIENQIGFAKVVASAKPDIIAERGDMSDEEWIDSGCSLEYDTAMDYNLVKEE